jgi:hypothetical protein
MTMRTLKNNPKEKEYNMSKFDTEETAITSLIENKKPDCVEALEKGFWQNRQAGLDIREAYYKAQYDHFLNDHDGVQFSPKLTIPETDESIRQALIEGGMENNEDGKAEDRIDVLIRWYDFFRALGGTLALAFRAAVEAGQVEWDDFNSLDEAEAISKLNDIPSEKLKDVALKAFYIERNKGNNVNASLRKAVEKAREALGIASLMEMLSGGGRSN